MNKERYEQTELEIIRFQKGDGGCDKRTHYPRG